MIRTVRRIAIVIPLLAAAPALAQAPDDYRTDVIVVTPQPVVVTGATPQPPGAAEMPPVPAVQPAPQNEQWTNVSHINGQVVPVGQRGDYLYKTKKINIASNPIGWMTGFYGLSVSHAINDNAAIRGDANLFNDIMNEGDSGFELGLTVPLYLRRVYSGPFVEGGVMIRDLDRDDSQGASIGPQVLFGWHWTFDSGFNVAFAAGIMRNMVAQEQTYDEYDSSESTIEPAWYFRVGYAY